MLKINILSFRVYIFKKHNDNNSKHTQILWKKWIIKKNLNKKNYESLKLNFVLKKFRRVIDEIPLRNQQNSLNLLNCLSLYPPAF